MAGELNSSIYSANVSSCEVVLRYEGRKGKEIHGSRRAVNLILGSLLGASYCVLHSSLETYVYIAPLLGQHLVVYTFVHKSQPGATTKSGALDQLLSLVNIVKST